MCFVGAFDFYRCGCHPGQQNWVRPLEVRVFIISKKFIKMMENIFQYHGEDISRWWRIYFKMMENIFQDYGEYISRWWKRYFQMIKNIFQVEKVTGVATGLRLDPAKLTQSTLHCAWVNIGSGRTEKVWFKIYLAVFFWTQMPDEANCVSLDHNCWFWDNQSGWTKFWGNNYSFRNDSCQPSQSVLEFNIIFNTFKDLRLSLRHQTDNLRFKTLNLLSVEFALTVHW